MRGHTLESVQDFYTDGYYHRYLSRKEIVALLLGAGLRPRRIIVTQYQKKLLPRVPGWLDGLPEEPLRDVSGRRIREAGSLNQVSDSGFEDWRSEIVTAMSDADIQSVASHQLCQIP